MAAQEDDQRRIPNGGHNLCRQKYSKHGGSLCSYHYPQKTVKSCSSGPSRGDVSQLQPIQSTVEGDKRFLSPNEKEIINSSILDSLHSDGFEKTMKEVRTGESNGSSTKLKCKSNPYITAKIDLFDQNIRMGIAHHERPTEDVSDHFTEKLEHTTSLQNSGNMSANAVGGVAATTVMKYNEQDTSSSYASFSISACMEELKKYHNVPMAIRLKALKELQSERWRETFRCMDEDMRKAWIESFD